MPLSNGTETVANEQHNITIGNNTFMIPKPTVKQTLAALSGAAVVAAGAMATEHYLRNPKGDDLLELFNLQYKSFTTTPLKKMNVVEEKYLSKKQMAELRRDVLATQSKAEFALLRLRHPSFTLDKVPRHVQTAIERLLEQIDWLKSYKSAVDRLLKVYQDSREGKLDSTEHVREGGHIDKLFFSDERSSYRFHGFVINLTYEANQFAALLGDITLTLSILSDYLVSPSPDQSSSFTVIADHQVYRKTQRMMQMMNVHLLKLERPDYHTASGSLSWMVEHPNLYHKLFGQELYKNQWNKNPYVEDLFKFSKKDFGQPRR